MALTHLSPGLKTPATKRLLLLPQKLAYHLAFYSKGLYFVPYIKSISLEHKPQNHVPLWFHVCKKRIYTSTVHVFKYKKKI